MVNSRLACLPLRGQFTLKRIRIRSAQLRGFASLSFIASRSNRPPPNPAPSSLRSQKKTTRKKRGCFSRVSPLRVFSFALFGLLASGSALGGSPVPRWFCLWRGVSGFFRRSRCLAVFMFRFCAWFCFRIGSFAAGGRSAFVLSASGFWFRAWRFCLARVPVPPAPRRRWRLLRAVCPVCLGARRRGCRCCAPSPVCCGAAFRVGFAVRRVLSVGAFVFRWCFYVCFGWVLRFAFSFVGVFAAGCVVRFGGFFCWSRCCSRLRGGR